MALSTLYQNRTRSTQPGMNNNPAATTNTGVSMAGPAPMNNDPVASTNAGVSMGPAPNDIIADNMPIGWGGPSGYQPGDNPYGMLDPNFGGGFGPGGNLDMWGNPQPNLSEPLGGDFPQYGYAPGQQWMPQPGNYAPNPYFAGWAGEGMGGGESAFRSGPSGYSTPGVSPYNVNVGQVDYDTLNSNFINPAFDQMMSRLNPQFDQQRQRFDQNMINRGIPVGSEAYNAALQQMDWNINDATQSAAVGAMGFGLGAQDQMFQQGLGESSLANALARAQMADATQRFGLGMDYDMGMRRLGEMGRQYDYDYGLRSDALDWSQMMDLEDLTFRDYTTELGNQRYSDNLALSLMGGIPGFTPNPSGMPMGALGLAADNAGANSAAWNSWLTDMGNMWGNFDWGSLFGGGE